MKKVKKTLVTLLPSFFIIGMVLNLSSCASNPKDEAGEDTAIYSQEDGVKDYNLPDIVYNAADDDDDDDEPFVAPSKVTMHYYNENGVTGSAKGSQRAFYIWATGVDGIEISRYENSEYYSAEGTMMTLTIDYSLPLFAPYANKSSLMFIIKYEKKSQSDENWGGQSEDMQLSFRTFTPDANKFVEVWTMPSAGGGIAILDSYNKTQVHGVKLAEFTDWKTIHCEVTDNTRSVDWKLYAFDETYYKVKAKKRAEIERWYLVKEGKGSGKSFDITLKYEIHPNVVYTLVSHDPDSNIDPDMAELNKTAVVSFENLYFTEKFHTYYENANKDVQLGMTYASEGTTFRVWSPMSANMTLLLYEDGTPTEFADDTHPGDDKYKGYHMAYKSGGIWEVTIVNEDLKGKYYNIQVDNSLGTNVTMDPYATSAGVSGQRGYIYDKNELKPEGWDAFSVGNLDPKKLAIYEIHIQDLTSDDSWVSNHDNRRGTYNAFVESGTKLAGTSLTTGFDHIKELGVNAIQITPTFDHDNDERPDKMKYNWGYNPLNYNIPEGGYSSDPFNGATRVKEFRNLVLQMSKTPSKTRVIMDVVYNHVSSASASNFNKLMPRYYFRYARMDHVYHWTDDYGNPQTSTVSKGTMWDGSGCNNEVATERPMMRKFIVDSLCMWARDYKIKGFRFDLMGLIDFKTMQEAQRALYTIDPSIYLYGEGWTSGGYHGEGSEEWKKENPLLPDPHNYGAFKWQVYNECNKQKVTDGVPLGSFNDTTRNQLRGGNDGHKWEGYTYPGSGFVQGDGTNARNVAEGLWGADVAVNTGKKDNNNNDYSVCSGVSPDQTVNYASCHDNWTVRDQLYDTVASGDPADQGASDQRVYRLIRESIIAHSMIFASNTPAFIQGGEELLRTKDLGFDPNEHPEYNVKPSDTAPMYGHWICHNSYNTPAYVNAFKWSNKDSITINYNSFDTTIDADNWDGDLKSGIHGITGIFADMIKLHKETNKKSGGGVEDWDALFKKTSKGNDVGDVSWNTGSNYGMQINETFIYVGIGDGGDVWADKNVKSGGWTRYVKSGLVGNPYYEESAAKIPFEESSCICIYYANGKR